MARAEISLRAKITLELDCNTHVKAACNVTRCSCSSTRRQISAPWPEERAKRIAVRDAPRVHKIPSLGPKSDRGWIEQMVLLSQTGHGGRLTQSRIATHWAIPSKNVTNPDKFDSDVKKKRISNKESTTASYSLLCVLRAKFCFPDHGDDPFTKRARATLTASNRFEWAVPKPLCL